MIQRGSTETSIETARSLWGVGGSRQSSSGLYALALVPLDLVSRTSDLSVAASGDKLAREFVFNVNPRSIDVEEPVAMDVNPTQDGSQFVENQGILYKNITISGTTGLRPNRRTNRDVIPILGIPNPFSVPDVSSITGLPVGEASGFQDLLALRNMFRAYSDIKRSRDAHRFILVWQNGKEGEFYQVEPQSFRTRRDSSSPVTATYEIKLQTINRLDFTFKPPKDTRNNLRGLVYFNARLSKITAELGSGIRRLEAFVDQTVGLTQATASTVLGLAKEISNGIARVTLAGANAIDIPRNTVAQCSLAARDLMRAFQTAENKLLAYRSTGVSTRAAVAMHAAKRIHRATSALFVEDSLFREPATSKYDQRARAYRSAVTGQPLTGGSATSLANVSTPGSTTLVTITGFDTMFSLAKRVLGDAARWKELALLNNLKAPYISEQGDGKAVLRPGDRIRVPAFGGAPETGVEEDREDADELVRRLGRDIKLVSLADGTKDFAVNDRGDLELVEGADNLAQAIEARFSTEQGELMTHPRYGVQAPIGTKAQLRSLVEFQLNVRASVLSDSRIGAIERLQFFLEGNVLTVDAAFRVADVDERVTVGFSATR